MHTPRRNHVNRLVSLPAMFGLVFVILGSAMGQSTPSPDDRDGLWVTYPGGDGPGTGQHVVLVSGDEEYRSEEALPQLGKILSEHHGFRCTVLFAIDPASGEISPDTQTNIPGLEALADADLMIIATRFRDLPDSQMRHIDAYLKSGRPVVGMRTATHAFAIRSSDSFRRYTWNNDDDDFRQGFGRQVLGETWIAHHGRHGSESTRGLLADSARLLPVTRGLADGDIWGPTDVYAVRLPLPEPCEPLVMGQVVAGMQPDDPPVRGSKNDPMMPIAWTTRYRIDDGPSGRVFTTTMGAATDLVSAGTRRMLVNGVYWALGMEDAIPIGGTRVDLVGTYRPTAFGFGGYLRGIAPSAHALPTRAPEPPSWPRGAAITSPPADAGATADASPPADPGAIANASPPADASPPAASDDDSATASEEAPTGGTGMLGLSRGETLMILGATFAERLAQSGYLEALAYSAHAELDLTIRSLAWSADQVALRVREKNVPTVEQHVDTIDPDALLMMYGMSESFAGSAGLADFERDLGSYLDRLERRPDGSRRRIVLVSPIAHEDLGAPWLTGDALQARNDDVGAYVEAMNRVASQREHGFIDLFHMPFLPKLPAAPLNDFDHDADLAHLTSNGIHPNERGAASYSLQIGRQLGWLDRAAEEVDDAELEAAERLRLFACDKQYLFFLSYRPTNTEYVWGRRAKPFGVVNFPPEWAQLERMIQAREREIWKMDGVDPLAVFIAAGRREPDATTAWETLPARSIKLPADSWQPPPVEAKGTETSLGSLDILPPEQFAASFTIADGYTIECFASEQEFPDLGNSVGLAFDARGRLWVLCIPTYPHLLPGDDPRCKLVILEDTDGDGRADKHSVWADRLYIPTGFAVGTNEVWVGQAPDLLRLRDTDGDGAADRRDIVLTGFAMPDSHHQISAFEWAPGGGFLMHEGVFSVSAIETPYGTRRTRDAAVWHFDPRTGRLETLSHCGFSNPWGHVFDDYGQSVLADASGGDNFSFSHVIHGFTYPRKPGRPGPILNRGRPTAGCELISSRHFPPDVQDSFLVNQSIGFHGTRWDRLEPAGSSWRAERMPQDLITCSDTNFRPVAMEIGPDGALYIVDWCNPIIGHMQYSVRDPRRDNSHGRIWRVRHAERALVDAPDIVGADQRQLLELLRTPERNTRALVRERLYSTDPASLLPVVDRWLAGLDPADVERDRLLLEGLWIHQAHGDIDRELVERVARVYEPRARAGAVRVLRHWLQSGAITPGAAAPVLETAADDDDMRVRLEAVIAAGFMPRADGSAIITRAAERPMDQAMTIVLRETLTHLGSDGGSESLRRLVLESTPAAKLLEKERDDIVSSVLLARDDIELSARLEALTALAGSADADRAARLVDEISRSRTERGIRAIGGLLLTIPEAASRPLESRLRTSLTADSAAARQVAMAALMRLDRLADGDAASTTDMIAALAMLEAGSAPPAGVEALRRAIDSDSLPADDRIAGIEQVVRHSSDPADVLNWLRAKVDEVDQVALADWTVAHESAMAALRGMHLVDRNDWPESLAPYAVADVSEKEMARGREIYHDEEIGCVRCHAADGGGLEGFPRLDRSPWLLGDPERAAAIVVHGLYGRIPMPDGAEYSSAMAPLGQSLDDPQVAAVLNYTRRSWGNFAAPVTVADVARARAATPEFGGMWEAPAMAAAYPLENDGLLTAIDSPVAVAGTPASAPSAGSSAMPPDPGEPVDGSATGTIVKMLLAAAGIVLVIGALGVLMERMSKS